MKVQSGRWRFFAIQNQAAHRMAADGRNLKYHLKHMTFAAHGDAGSAVHTTRSTACMLLQHACSTYLVHTYHHMYACFGTHYGCYISAVLC